MNFIFNSSRVLAKVKKVLGFTSGGVYKRLDENRELLELLQRGAPEFLETHPWVVGWLAAHDEFFTALASAVPLTECSYPALRSGLLRAWPGCASK